MFGLWVANIRTSFLGQPTKPLLLICPHCIVTAILGGEDQEGNGDGEDPASMLSVKEERDLHTLLDMFAMGVGDVDQFQTRLQDELAALEVPV